MEPGLIHVEVQKGAFLGEAQPVLVMREGPAREQVAYRRSLVNFMSRPMPGRGWLDGGQGRMEVLPQIERQTGHKFSLPDQALSVQVSRDEPVEPMLNPMHPGP